MAHGDNLTFIKLHVTVTDFSWPLKDLKIAFGTIKIVHERLRKFYYIVFIILLQSPCVECGMCYNSEYLNKNFQILPYVCKLCTHNIFALK